VCEQGIALDTRPIQGIVASERTAVDPGCHVPSFCGLVSLGPRLSRAGPGQGS
jgi:hypothetical protein